LRHFWSARYLLLRDRALSLSHGTARLIAGIVLAVILVASRLLARRR
jgi:hypothetical protein